MFNYYGDDSSNLFVTIDSATGESDRLPELVDLLWREGGVRYFVGLPTECLPRSGGYYDSNTVNPLDLAPLPAFILPDLDNFALDKWAEPATRFKRTENELSPWIIAVDAEHPSAQTKSVILFSNLVELLNA